ncbi:MAG: DUF1311 domain-containing protein [Magnetococcales bacterium]|nr:DUF1311 domain-containing protein [Magnetococcales bacterium]
MVYRNWRRGLACSLFALGLFSGVGLAAEEATPPLKAGFDCRKASSAVEKMICADQRLAALDAELSARYKEAVRSVADPEALQRAQRSWLQQERNLCSTPDCLLQIYPQRLQALSVLGNAGATAAAGKPSPFPAVYLGGFTGKERLQFMADGRLLVAGEAPGRYQSDHNSPWKDAQYPLLLIVQEQGETVERHCKVQPDWRMLICDDGGTLAATYLRQGAMPVAAVPTAQRCDAEQLYLDVMAAARQARPQWDLKGSTGIVEDKPGHCLISLYYLHDGQAVDVKASYAMKSRPVKLQIHEASQHVR